MTKIKNMEFLFSEKQKFNQWWVWLFLLALNILFVYGIILQVIFKIPFGNKPAPDALLIIFALIPIGITWLIYRFELITGITKEGIVFQLKPLHSEVQKINWSQIKKAYVRTYSPLKEYGGWGYKFGTKGKAYNIRGNKGLQLELKNGQQILIGTQKAEELECVISAVSEQQ
jgi:hypothetical protein